MGVISSIFEDLVDSGNDFFGIFVLGRQLLLLSCCFLWVFYPLDLLLLSFRLTQSIILQTCWDFSVINF